MKWILFGIAMAMMGVCGSILTPDQLAGFQIAAELENIPFRTVVEAVNNSYPYVLKYFQAIQATGKMQCIKRFSAMINHLITDEALVGLVGYSGLRVNDLGDYMSCIKNEERYYVKLVIRVGQSIQRRTVLNYALCLPRDCDLKLVESMKPAMVYVLSKILPYPISKENITMSDILEHNQRLNALDLPRWSACLGLLAYIFFVIVISILDYNNWLLNPNKWILIVRCFSFYRNTQDLVNTRNPFDENLDILHGIRVIAFAWIVLGHSFCMLYHTPLSNYNELLQDATGGFSWCIIKSAVLAIDVFFLLSGFLSSLRVAHIFKDKANHTFGNIIKCYISRFTRLFPWLLFMVLIIRFVQPSFYDSNTNELTETEMEKCNKGWPYTLLMLGNYFQDYSEMCMNWSWYISVDFQLFLAIPIVCLLYRRKKTLGFFIISVLCGGLIFYQFSAIKINNLSLSLFNPKRADSQVFLYNKPISHAIPYLMGVFLFFIYDGSCTEKQPGFFKALATGSRFLRYLGYLLGIALMLTAIYSFYLIDKDPQSWPATYSALHMLLCSPAFLIGLLFIIYPILVGKGKFLLAILGYQLFTYLSRINYGAYMFHVLIFHMTIIYSYTNKFYDDFELYVTASGVFFIAYVASYFLTLAIERPFEKIKLLLLSSENEAEKKTIKIE